MTKDRTPFGKRLFDAREAAGLTQVQASEAIGISQGTLAGLEKTAYKSKYAVQLANLYGVDAMWLAEGLGEMASSVGGTGKPILNSRAHTLSLEPVTIGVLSWEALASMNEVPIEFWCVMTDDAMSPIAGQGVKMKFSKATEAKPGDAALLRDGDGGLYVREVHQERGGGLVGVPTNSRYARIPIGADGAHVVALVSGIDAGWAQLRRE